MSTNISVGNDIKDYLSRNGDKTSIKDNISGLLNGNQMKNWFYQPLSTEDNQNNDSNNSRRASTNSWFSSFSLSSNTQNDSNDWIPSLSRTQRIIGFLMFIGLGLFCFGLSTFYIPVLIFKARKFALLFTFGSLFIVTSFSVLWGPMSHLKHLFSKERLPFTLTYFGSLLMTLYFALKVQSTLFTTIFAVIQIISLFWYVISYLPGGQTGLMFFTKIATKAASKSLPV